MTNSSAQLNWPFKMLFTLDFFNFTATAVIFFFIVIFELNVLMNFYIFYNNIHVGSIVAFNSFGPFR